ncbi:unnamed protein product [Orchesella dallaii]|uniref:Uncharacterized protein n=1 Tax=Orchesella dallaii TaxID=48710 RepID=A0ABP1RQA3_9HEXA
MNDGKRMGERIWIDEEQILKCVGGNSNMVTWFLESFNTSEKGDWYRELVEKTFPGNTNLNKDLKLIKTWEDNEASKKPGLRLGLKYWLGFAANQNEVMISTQSTSSSEWNVVVANSSCWLHATTW